MVFHLGMSGQLADRSRRDRQARPSAARDRRRATARAQRSAAVRVARPDADRELDEWPPFAALGPEPLGDALSGALVQARFAGRSAAVKLLLLDQRIVAGLGNIYACEALYRAGINPRARGRLISLAAAQATGVGDPAKCSTKRSRRAGRACATSPARRRARLFFQAVRGLRPRRGGVRVRRQGQANRPGRPLDLLLPALPALDSAAAIRVPQYTMLGVAMGQGYFNRSLSLSLALGGVVALIVHLVITPLVPFSEGFDVVASSSAFLWRQSLSAVVAACILLGSAEILCRPADSAPRWASSAAALAMLGSAALIAQEWGEIFIIRALALAEPVALVRIDLAPGVDSSRCRCDDGACHVHRRLPRDYRRGASYPREPPRSGPGWCSPDSS